MSLVQHARSMSSIKTLASYSALFDDAFWVTRPLNDDEAHLKNACIYLADLLRGDRRHDGIMHLATYLREDAVRLHDVFDELEYQGLSQQRTMARRPGYDARSAHCTDPAYLSAGRANS